MQSVFQITRAILVNTLFDVAVISAVLYLAGELALESVFFGWLIVLVARFILGLRSALLRLLEHWLFRSERIDRITAALRLARISRDYEIASDFEALSHSVLSDEAAEPKAKQLVSEMVGYAQCASETGIIRGILYRLTLDAAVRRYLA